MLSCSWGANDPLITTLEDQLAAAGVLTVWANGNQGGDGTTSNSNPSPSLDPTPGVLTVASYDDGGTGTRDDGGDGRRRPRVAAFVEALLVAFPPLSFDLLCARSHARIWADLAASGGDIGPHDRLVAATALARGWRVATANVRHFERVQGLDTISLDLADGRSG